MLEEKAPRLALPHAGWDGRGREGLVIGGLAVGCVELIFTGGTFGP